MQNKQFKNNEPHSSRQNLRKGTLLTCRLGISLVFLFFTLIAQAQKPISGVVKSSIDNTAIPGVNVVIKGTTQGTITDMNGKFTISVSSGDILVLSFLGYLTEEVIISNQSSIEVSMIEDITRLDEVVVVGYGTMKRSDLTGAVATVTADDMKRTVGSSLDQALQGRVAGVFVTENSGQPGGSVSVRIRGINTFSNNEPLYVIDGIPVSGASGNSNNALSIINPNDIVSMEILKDASATAIYGSRASNGVILITTKRGEQGKTQISYDGYYGIQQLPFNVDVMDLPQYAAYSKERYAITYYGYRDEYNDPSVLGPGTNWQDELFRSAPMQNHQITLSSGNEKTQYNFSLGYFDQEGIAIGTDFNRLSGRLNIDNKAFKWLNFGINMNLSQTVKNVTVSDGELINLAIQQAPDIPAYNPDGTFGGPYDSNFPVSNPVAEASLRDNMYKNSFVQANVYAEIIFAKGLTFRNEFGGNLGFNNYYYFNPTYQLGTIINEVNKSTRSADNNHYWIIKNYLTYNKKLGEIHDFSVMVGHEAQENYWESLSGTRTDFLSNDIKELNAGDASTATNSGSNGSSAIESFFGRANYSLNDKYLLTATYRADGSSHFGPENRWGFFPSFSAAWKISNENFFQDITTINNMKLRAGWGVVGNQYASDYAYGATMGVIESDLRAGALQGQIANPFLQWESTQAYNLGLDVNLFLNRIEFITDVYYKTTDNLLIQPPYPSYVGTDSWTGEGGVITPWKNVGSLENKGVEFTLNTVNIDNSGFFWKSGFVFSMNRNKVLKLTSENSVINGLMEDQLMTQTVVGEPIGQLYGYVADGIFNNRGDFYYVGINGDSTLYAIPEGETIEPRSIWVGDYRWKDLNNDSIINEKDRTFIGNPNPKFQFSFNNYFRYKNFDLNIYLTGVYGNEIYNLTRNKYEDPVSRFNMLETVLGYARIEKIDPEGTDSDLSNVYISNPGGSVQRITSDNQNTNNRISSRFVEDGSYLRIKNITLGYTMPKQILSKVYLSNVRVYASVQNLYTFTNYTGYDPEIGSYNQNMLLSSIDNGRYPSQRIYTFGINITY